MQNCTRLRELALQKIRRENKASAAKKTARKDEKARDSQDSRQNVNGSDAVATQNRPRCWINLGKQKSSFGRPHRNETESYATVLEDNIILVKLSLARTRARRARNCLASRTVSDRSDDPLCELLEEEGRVEEEEEEGDSNAEEDDDESEDLDYE